MISKQQRNAGLVFLALGAYVIFYTLTELKLGTIHAPGSGFFTMICGCAIFILSAILLFQSFKKGTEDRPLWEKGGWKNPAIGFLLVCVYVALMPALGFIIDTILFLILWQVIIARAKVIQIALVSLIGTGAMYVIFEKLLRVPLPNGLLPF